MGGTEESTHGCGRPKPSCCYYSDNKLPEWNLPGSEHKPSLGLKPSHQSVSSDQAENQLAGALQSATQHTDGASAHLLLNKHSYCITGICFPAWTTDPQQWKSFHTRRNSFTHKPSEHAPASTPYEENERVTSSLELKAVRRRRSRWMT